MKDVKIEIKNSSDTWVIYDKFRHYNPDLDKSYDVYLIRNTSSGKAKTIKPSKIKHIF